jgi:hypothetical protein
MLGFLVADTDRVLPPSDSTADSRPCPLTDDTKWSRTSIITDPSTWVTGSMSCALSISRRAGLSVTLFPDPLGAAPSSLGQTLHHESLDPLGDLISACEADVIHGKADAMGRATPRAGSVPRSPPLRRMSLLGGCLPIHGRATAARCTTPWAASVPCSPPRCIPFTNGDP